MSISVFVLILLFHQNFVVLKLLRDFPGGPVVKTSPSNARGVGSIPGRGAKIPDASRTKPKH